MNTFIFIWIALGIVIFPLLLRVSAPYGRHIRKGWGPLIPNRMGWIIMEMPALLVMPLLFFTGSSPKPVVSWVFVGLWLLHYINRTLIFPLRVHTKGKKMPLAIVVFALFFNVVNGSINGLYFGENAYLYPETWPTDFRFVAGVGLFVTGLMINWQSDNILLRLRKPGETSYKIPRGGLFRYVSCPNHLGEIVEWTGFAVLTWSFSGFAFALWTAINLIPRALDHHKWYLNHFPDYPANRKAVFPFIL
ncbi:MAG: DUF1295 domain-containing protein [Bacteroidia bacterium]|nr:DUF1295 domain-containing protein [Bacteroidia bacterium]